MKRRMVVMLGVMAIFILGLGTVKFIQIRSAMAAGAKFAMPPSAVTTVVVKKEHWNPALTAVGSLKAVNGVMVSTDLSGIVSEINFQSGQAVKKDELLVKLDSKQEDAQLHSAEARHDLALANLNRYRDLVKEGAVSQSAFEAADSEARQAQAAVDDANAMMARKAIRAPFDGVLGIRQVDLGQYLNVGTPIVPLQSADPVYVDFSLPQQEMGQIKDGGAIRVRAEEIEDPFEGKITAIDSHVNPQTRNLLFQGTVPNPQHTLRPGMFVHVEVILPETETLFIPASSVNYAPYGDSVFTVKEGKAKEQFVKLGQSRGDQVSILSGVQEGDEVITSGVFKLRSGDKVVVNNAIQPGNEVNPTPPNS